MKKILLTCFFIASTATAIATPYNANNEIGNRFDVFVPNGWDFSEGNDNMILNRDNDYIIIKADKLGNKTPTMAALQNEGGGDISEIKSIDKSVNNYGRVGLDNEQSMFISFKDIYISLTFNGDNPKKIKNLKEVKEVLAKSKFDKILLKDYIQKAPENCIENKKFSQFIQKFAYYYNFSENTKIAKIPLSYCFSKDGKILINQNQDIFVSKGISIGEVKIEVDKKGNPKILTGSFSVGNAIQYEFVGILDKEDNVWIKEQQLGGKNIKTTIYKNGEISKDILPKELQ